MNQGLPTPEIVRRHVDEHFHRSAPVMSLRWPATARAERLWDLPDDIHIVGAPPHRFGFHVQRTGADEFMLRVLWNGTCFSWGSLSKMQLLSSALSPLLSALGMDLWSLLEQPGHGEGYVFSRAA